MARQYAALSHLRTRPSTYLDANSIDLETLDQIAALLSEHDIDFVDASIHGGAAKLSQLGVLYLSGPCAAEVGRLMQSVMQTQLLGDQWGQASSMKLLLAGMSKSLNALFLEMAVLAERTEMTEPFLESMQHFYPGIMTAIGRMLPTYPQHAARRVGELQSIGELADRLEAPDDMVTAATQVMQRVAAISWDTALLSGTQDDLPEIIRQAAEACQRNDNLALNDTALNDTMNRSRS
jgi:3-hydroxyisobutyrate dehydrogenase-like beta-hydroxyacid dehydrogenase